MGRVTAYTIIALAVLLFAGALSPFAAIDLMLADVTTGYAAKFENREQALAND